jgi:hypothetical protein
MPDFTEERALASTARVHWFIQRGVDLILAIVVILVLWTVNAEILHIGAAQAPRNGESRAAEIIAPGPPGALGIDKWQMGSTTLWQSSGVREVAIVDATSAEILRLNLDAVTGLPASEERHSTTAGAPLSVEEIRQRVAVLLSTLTVGETTRRQSDSFAETALLYEGRIVARVRVDPSTGRPLSAATAADRTQGSTREAESEDESDDESGGDSEGGGRLVGENLVTPLGWLAAILAIVVTLYYSLKHSLIGHLTIAEAGKQQAAAALKMTLNYHCLLSFVALGLAALHSVSQVRWSISWLTLAMMATVVVSGVFGKYWARTEFIRVTWRRFHVPYTVLFFVVLTIHILQNIQFGGD